MTTKKAKPEGNCIALPVWRNSNQSLQHLWQYSRRGDGQSITLPLRCVAPDGKPVSFGTSEERQVINIGLRVYASTDGYYTAELVGHDIFSIDVADVQHLARLLKRLKYRTDRLDAVSPPPRTLPIADIIARYLSAIGVTKAWWPDAGDRLTPVAEGLLHLAPTLNELDRIRGIGQGA